MRSTNHYSTINWNSEYLESTIEQVMAYLEYCGEDVNVQIWSNNKFAWLIFKCYNIPFFPPINEQAFRGFVFVSTVSSQLQRRLVWPETGDIISVLRSFGLHAYVLCQTNFRQFQTSFMQYLPKPKENHKK